LHGAAVARPPARRTLARSGDRPRHAALDDEGDHAHQPAEDRPLQPSSHGASLTQLEARRSAEIDPGALLALDDPDHHGLAVSAAHDDPRAGVDVEPGHLLVRTAV